jgi:amidase
MEDIIFSTATALANAIREKHVSATEVLEAHLAQIAKYNPSLNAIVVMYEEVARARARQADEALARGDIWGPLHGVPVTLKNMHSVAGVLSPWLGFPEYANRIPTEDSAMPAKLRQAGALIMGLMNAHAMDNNIFGVTNNPWDVRRSPSGSSAGSAVGVAAGLSPLDIGNDSLGSILIPASFCGVFGMRPTEHRISNAGTKVFGIPYLSLPFTVSGPLTRSVEDLELAVKVISGPDGRDPNVPPLGWREVMDIRLQNIRIAWSHTFPKMPIAENIRSAIESLVAELSTLGTYIKQAQPELDFVKAHALAFQIHPFIWEDLFRAGGFIASDATPLQIANFYDAICQREEIIRIWEQFFTEWDVFLGPVTMHTANLLTDTTPVVDGKAYSWEELSPSTETISPLTGLPSVVVPVGLDSQGLPICLQLIGRRWEDERLLAIAKLVSEITGGFRKPPGY